MDDIKTGANYTPKEIAAWSKLSASMVRKEIAAGNLHAKRFGDRLLRIRGEDALEWYNNRLEPINSDGSKGNIASFGERKARGADTALASVRSARR